MPSRSILSSQYDRIPEKRIHRMKAARREIREVVLQKIESGHYELEEVPCLCGSRETDLVSNFDRDYLPVKVVLCKRCGMMYLSPRLTREALEEFYANEYRDLYNPHMRGNVELYRRSIKEPNPCHEKIQGILKTKPETVFEVGMHYGALLSRFKETGSRVAGVDLDPGGLDFARDELGITALQGNSKQLLELGEQADLLMYIHVIEHINDLDAEFQVMRMLVKDNGYLYLSVPGAIQWARHKDDDLFCTLQLAHSWYFSLPHLVYKAAQHGFGMVWGDESVDALFIKQGNDHKHNQTIPDEYEKVKNALLSIHKDWTRQRRKRKLRQFFHL